MSAKYVGSPSLDLLKYSYTIHNDTTISSGVETPVITYTVPPGKKFILDGGSSGGPTDAIYKLYINSNVLEVKQNNWCERDIVFGVKYNLQAGDIIEISVIHNSSSSWVFNASIFGFLI